MTFEEFERQVRSVKGDAPLDNVGMFMYDGLAMAGEAGEAANVVKKAVRDYLPWEEVNEALLEECGDVLFYMRRLLARRGLRIEDAANTLLDKIEQLEKEARL